MFRWICPNAGTRFDELVRAMGDTAFTGRQIGDCRRRFSKQMARDKDCFVVMTLSGALNGLARWAGFLRSELKIGPIAGPSSRPARSWRMDLVRSQPVTRISVYNPNRRPKELFRAGKPRVRLAPSRKRISITSKK